MQASALKRCRRVVISSDSEESGNLAASPHLHHSVATEGSAAYQHQLHDDSTGDSAADPHLSQSGAAGGSAASLHLPHSEANGGPASDPQSPQSDAESSGAADVSSDGGSSDSQDPISRKARKWAIHQANQRRAEQERQDLMMSPFLYAAKFGHFPAKPATASDAPKPQPHIVPEDVGYLWNAQPPATSQYLNLEAAHGDSTSPGSTGSSEGSLSDSAFIDKGSADYTEEELVTLQQFFPVTSRRFLPKVQISPPTHRSTLIAHSI